MICGMKLMTTVHARRSCHRSAAHKRGVLLCTTNLEQQMHRWQVDLHTATAAGAAAQPVDAGPQQTAIPQPPQRTRANT